MAPKSHTLSPNDGGLQPPKSPKNLSQALSGRSRSPGHGQIRKLADEWNNADDIDDGRDEALEISDDEAGVKSGEAVEKRSPSGGQIIDLLDIARPAKPKGIAREFEVVQGSPSLRIVALPDEPLGPEAQEEDWEDIDSGDIEPRKSYSAVVRESESD